MGNRRGRRAVTGVLLGSAIAAFPALAGAVPAGAEVRGEFAVPAPGAISVSVFRLDAELAAGEKAPPAAGAQAIKRKRLGKRVVLVGTIRRLPGRVRGRAGYLG